MDKHEKRIIKTALARQNEYFLTSEVSGFRLRERVVTPHELADLLEKGDEETMELAQGAAREARDFLAGRVAKNLHPRYCFPGAEAERAYADRGIPGWLDTLHRHIGVADYEFQDQKQTYLGSFAGHFLGKDSEFHGRTIESTYLQRLVNKCGITKPRRSDY
ncbi:hypothetical protein HYT55_05640 [Candidatus Woesearchaeota archaeon]|nr:hypothetical protein [Candidatus Woesearchaeota archaeon]